ncbi:hypothetical protein AGMMS49546_33340 [Spirochaetia bacterium]|nr:hypothetical protein AGMMS49546_33340 [Spirochaetia bacterium]
MINIFVDPTLLAFPKEVADQEEDILNITRFLNGIHRLYNLACKPQVVLMVKKGLDKWIEDNGYYYSSDRRQNQRIDNSTRKMNNNYDSPHITLSKFYDSFFNDHQVVLFGNDDTKESNIQDIIASNEFKDICKGLSNPYFEVEHKKLLGYVARLNYEYPYEENRIIVIAGSSQKPIDMEIKLSPNMTSRINMFSVKKADNLFEEEYINEPLATMYESANRQFNNDLVFSSSISEHTDSIIWNNEYDNPFMVSKLFYNLETLSKTIQHNKNIDDINMAVRKHGLNSVKDKRKQTDYRDYEKCPFRKWDGQRQFTLHLRPTTRNRYRFVEDSLTMRIYFDKEKEQILIGMICSHPDTCDNCESNSISNYPCEKETIGGAMTSKNYYNVRKI